MHRCLPLQILLLWSVPFLIASLNVWAQTPGISPFVNYVELERPASGFSGWTWTDSDLHKAEHDISFHLTLGGFGLGANTEVGFTTSPATRGSLCTLSSILPQTFKVTTEVPATDLLHLSARLPFSLEANHRVFYLCISNEEGLSSNDSTEFWIHQGNDINITLGPTGDESFEDEPSLSGVRAEGDRVYILSSGVVSIPSDQTTVLRLTGRNFGEGRKILLALTLSRRSRGSSCDDLPTTAVFTVEPKDVLADNVLAITVDLPELEEGEHFYFCIKDATKSKGSWIHQGDQPWLRVFSEGRLIPKWLQVWLIVILQIMSGLFSGLNLGLMSLDKTELTVIGKCGTRREKEYARVIAPLRSRGNYLLCSIVLGNVLVNSLLTVMLDDLTSGLTAVIGSTVGIVIFGEIIPQAICSRHGLAVGAMTVWITKLFMVLTFPMSYPISRILDCCLGEEIGNVYDRERLMEYIKVIEDYKKLEKEEVNIISGALELKKKTARDIMTAVEDVYMISMDAMLDFEAVAEILRQGYTRVPVFESDRNNVVGLLHTKDLALVDPDDNTPVKSLCHFYNHPIIFVLEDERLDILLNEFKKGKSHLACVRSVHTAPEEDPHNVIEGIVTLEDVIEEIIQSEIMDETDTLTDNRRKLRRKGPQIFRDFSDFVKIGSGKSIISPQLALAVFQFLSTAVDPFRKAFVSESVLRRLLTQNIFFALKHRSFQCAGAKCCSSDDSSRSVVTLYKTGKPADYFLLVLEGRVKVTVGKERLMYEAGPFTYFGLPAIMHLLPPGEMAFLSSTPRCGHQQNHSVNSYTTHGVNYNGSLLQVPGSSPSSTGVTLPISTSPFVPDYTVVAASDIVYMKVHKSIYAAALKATLLERQHRSDTSIDDCFQECRRSDCTPPNPTKSSSPLPTVTSEGVVIKQQDATEPSSSQYLLTTGSASISAFNVSS